MICLNCGRPNPSGTSLCYRCRERRPGLERARGGVIYQRTRETARVRRSGSGILVVGVLLLAGLIFAGGTLAVLLAPRGPAATNPAFAIGDPTPSRLEIFEQITPTPEPTATPWFPSFTPGASPTDFGSFFPSLSPSGLITLPPPTVPGSITPRPTRPPTPTPTATAQPTPTPEPTPTPQPVAGFTWTQTDVQTIKFKNTSSAPGATWLWDFGGGSTSDQKSPSHVFPLSAQAETYTVTLLVTNGGGSDSETGQVTVEPPPPTPTPTESPTPSVTASLAGL